MPDPMRRRLRTSQPAVTHHALILRLTGVGLVVVALLAGCGSTATPIPAESALPSSPPSTGTSASPAPPAALTIFGAASLKGALDQLKTSYESGHPGTTLTISTDSSATLRTQIEQGAPVDVFLSADVTNPKKLVDGGLADGAAVDFAGNLLTLVVPSDNPAKIVTPADLARSGVKIIAAGDDVPITKYAVQAVGLLAKLPGYPAGFAAGYAANIVSREDNVKAVIAKIELGEGDAGIVYVTDARASTKVKTIDIPPDGNIPATYAGVVVKASKNLAAAHAFLDWMSGAEAQVILTQLGFTAPQT
jgi:molybdate transport system substrate-binding protein